MEKLIWTQKAQREIMEKFVTNYRKDGKERRTKTYYEKRLKEFEGLWSEFQARHKELLVMKYSDKEFAEKEIDYFAEDVFLNTEEFFFANYTLICDRFKSEFPAKSSETPNTSSNSSVSTKEDSKQSIKLPKISLEKFYGDYRKWSTFHDLFRSLIHENRSLAPVEKLQYLKLHLGGEPDHLLRHFLVTDGNYKAAWELLTERYNNKRVQVNTHLQVLFSQSSLTGESAKGVKELLDTTTECLQVLSNLEIDTTSWDPIIVYFVVNRLPPETHQLWEQSVSKGKDLPSWNNLKEFLESRFRTLEAIFSKGSAPSKDNRNCQKSKSSHRAFHMTSKSVCPVCTSDHNIRACNKFSSLNSLKKFDIVKEKGLCINCLGSGHIVSNCPSQSKCYHCKKRHHTLLHRNSNDAVISTSQTRSGATNFDPQRQNNVVPQQVEHSSQPATNALSATTPAFVHNASGALSSFFSNHAPGEQVLLATALVKVVSPTGQKQIVRALIDQGSQASFLTESVAQNLKLKRESICASIQGLGRSEVSQVNSRVKFTIQSLKSNMTMEISGLVLRRITNLLPSKTVAYRNWNYIENIDLADPQFHTPGKIDLLLGADVYGQIVMDGLIGGVAGGPLAQKTSLGWILLGEICNGNMSNSKINTLHVCANLDNELKRFWELEEISHDRILTDEEEACEESFINSFRRLSSGRYEVELPLKQETRDNYLGKSRHIALSRLYQLEDRLKRHPLLKDKYIGCLREYLELGHMKRIDTTEEHFVKNLNGLQSYKCNYLPHHAVVKESSTTTKLRVVFDASRATSSGISLNDRLLKGSVIQEELLSLLTRWRKHKVAFTADIEKMYRQVRVRDHHAEYQRIVWRESPNDPVEDYKLTTVTFGTKSAPYQATRVLKQLALDEAAKYPIGSRVAQMDLYVDDVLSGSDNIESAKHMQKELIELMESGGFSLRKWASNYNELLEGLPIEHCEVKLPFKADGEEGIRALGIHWNPRVDDFTYSLNIQQESKNWTKRSILSEVSKLFDPLGWLCPSIIVAKILIQKLWLLGLDWDEEVPAEICLEWTKYRDKMKDVSKIHINRWLHSSERDAKVELHGFSDASVKAYAAAVYLCTINERGERHVTLLNAKTRVAPIKTVSLPRLELCGAALLAKLLKYVTKSLNMNKSMSIHAWTDSEIVIAWLRSHPIKWTTFVANRVSEIHELLGQNVWSHVPSKENPADCASRGMYPEDLQRHKLWWNGPKWLWQSSLHWPGNKEMPSTSLEERASTNHHANIIIEELEAKYSTLTRLLRVLAYCKRFIRNARGLRSGRKTEYLNASEIQDALHLLIRRVQQQHFGEEIRALRSNKPVNRNSRLLKLNPFLDSEELVRVGGRLKHSGLPYNEMHPLILPDKGHLTELIIKKLHGETLHGGPQLMMNLLSKTYWLLNARNTIRHHIHNCIPCFKQRASVQTQLMGDLPSPRVRMSRPFQHTGLDYSGPFELKAHKGRNPKKYKAYIALFVCMATKAIHLELVTDLTAEGFLAAFRRFCARRGLCSQIYCDCGTNFVGANKLLLKQTREMVDQTNIKIAETLENEGVKFNFIPPASPHFGGLWEAGVRSTKYHLKRVLGNATLTYEEFNTVLTQIEACLNSRPLCELSRDPNDLNPLTPGHFLTGNAILTPPDPSVLEIHVNRLDRWQFMQRIYQDFWKRWNTEYLSRLQQRPKWLHKTENVKIGDLVILKDEKLPPCRWNLGRVLATHPGSDGLVRVVTLQTKDAILKRPIAKICLMPDFAGDKESSTSRT